MDRKTIDVNSNQRDLLLFLLFEAKSNCKLHKNLAIDNSDVVEYFKVTEHEINDLIYQLQK